MRIVPKPQINSTGTADTGLLALGQTAYVEVGTHQIVWRVLLKKETPRRYRQFGEISVSRLVGVASLLRLSRTAQRSFTVAVSLSPVSARSSEQQDGYISAIRTGTA